MDASDATLLERWQRRRDADAFAELVQRHSAMVYASCKRILGEQGLAEDVAQECFVTLMQTHESVRASLGAWLHSIAVRRSIDRVRSDVRRRKREEVYAESQDNASESDVSHTELLGYVDEAIAELPEGLKSIVIGRFLEHRTHADLARELEMPESTLRHRLEKAADRIRESLRKRGIAVATGLLVAALEQTAEAVPPGLMVHLNKLALSGSVVASVTGGASALALWAKVGVALLAVAAIGLGIWRFSSPAKTTSPIPMASASQTAHSASSGAEGRERSRNGNTSTAQSAPERAPATASKPAAGSVYAIQGRVYDAKTGRGIPKVEVEISPAGGGRVSYAENLTDEQGRYSVRDMPDGTYWCRVDNVDGYPFVSESHSRSVTVKGVKPVTGIDFALRRGFRVAGTVQTPDRQPVADADVRGATPGTPNPLKTQTHDDGHFELFMPEASDNLRLQAESNNAESATQENLALGADGLDGVLLVLDRPKTASISGVVVDAQGKGMDGAQLHLLRKDQSVNPFGQAGKSNAQGEFTLGDLASADYSVIVTPEGSNGFSSSEEYLRIHLEPGEAATGIRIVYGEKGGMAIAGRVIDSEGKPISDARVMCFVGAKMENAHTDHDGKFVITGLENKSYTLRAEHYDYSDGSKSFAAGTMDAEIVLKGMGALRGKVVRADTGAALTGFTFAYIRGAVHTLNEMLYSSGRPISSADGTFSIETVPTGSFTIAAWAPGFAPTLHTVTVEENKSTDIEFQLKTVAPYEGLVVNDAGEAVAGATVYFVTGVSMDRMDRAAAAYTDADGRFVIDSLSESAAFISAYHVGYGIGTSAISGDHKIVLPAEATLEGIVQRGDGMQDVAVNVYYTDEPQAPATQINLPPDGRYRVTGLTPGTATIGIVPNGLEHYLNRTIVISAGQKLTSDFEFTRGTAQVSGTVRCAGEAVTNVALELQRRTGDMIETLRIPVDADGHFQMDRVWAGNLVLKISRWDTGDVQEIDLQTQEGQTLTQDIDLPAQP